jgi:TIR domain
MVTHDVFISYSHEDKPVADAACAVLERHGVRCWIAPRDVTPGMSYGESIMDAIAEARVMVLIFSDHANKSSQVEREIERAVSKESWIIPIRIEDVAPRKSLEYFISTSHWLDALTPPMEQHLERLADAVRKLLTSLDSPPTPPLPGTQADAESGSATTKDPAPETASVNHFVGVSTPTQGATSAPTQRWRQPKTIAIAAAASVVLAIVAVVGYLLLGRSSPDSAASKPANAPAAPSSPPVAPASASAVPAMSGHYTVTETLAGSPPVTENWYFTACGDGCVSVATAPGGAPLGQARLVNGRWAMDVSGSATCQDGSWAPDDTTSVHNEWDANTLAGTTQVTNKVPACGNPVGAQWTSALQLRQAP